MNNVIELNHRKGKLIVCSSDYLQHTFGDMYFYVEAYHFEPIDGAYYLDILAPSLDMYIFIMDAIKSKEHIKEDSKIFKDNYNKQLKSDLAARALSRIAFYLQEGNTIVLFSDPVDLEFNHLIVLGNYFKQLNYIVDFKISLASMNPHLNNLLVENIRDYL